MMEGKIKLYSIPIDGDGFEFMTAVHVDDYDNLVAGAEALAAEVARLTAENAALRAQLDAATAWRPVTELPEDGATVQLRTVEMATWDSKREMWAIGPDSLMSIDWRPAPPQE